MLRGQPPGWLRQDVGVQQVSPAHHSIAVAGGLAIGWHRGIGQGGAIARVLDRAARHHRQHQDPGRKGSLKPRHRGFSTSQAERALWLECPRSGQSRRVRMAAVNWLPFAAVAAAPAVSVRRKACEPGHPALWSRMSVHRGQGDSTVHQLGAAPCAVTRPARPRAPPPHGDAPATNHIEAAGPVWRADMPTTSTSPPCAGGPSMVCGVPRLRREDPGPVCSRCFEVRFSPAS